MARFKCKACSCTFDDEVKGLVYCPNCAEIQPLPDEIDEATKEIVYDEIVKVAERATKASNLKDAVTVFTQLDGYKDSKAYIERCNKKLREIENDEVYAEALQNMELETLRGYKKAIELFSTIPEWKNSSFKIDEARVKIEELLKKLEERKDKIAKFSMIGCACLIVLIAIIFLFIRYAVPSIKYSSALEELELGNYDEAYAALEELGDYKDSVAKIQESKYNRAFKESYEDLTLDEKKACITLFKQIREYSDTKSQLLKIASTLRIEEQLDFFDIGDTVVYGHYEQDESKEGYESLKWVIAEKKEDKVLIVCENVIEAKAFSTAQQTIFRWSTSELRTWLNTTFITSAFYKQDLDNFCPSDIKTNFKLADGTPDYDSSSNDIVFILSEEEANTYFSTNDERCAYATPYLKTKTTHINEGNNGARYWLRTPTADGGIKYVNGSGGISIFEKSADTEFGVCPAMWIKK